MLIITSNAKNVKRPWEKERLQLSSFDLGAVGNARLAVVVVEMLLDSPEGDVERLCCGPTRRPGGWTPAIRAA